MTVSNATDNGQHDSCLQYTPYGLPLNGTKYLPIIKKLLYHMSTWSGGRDKARLPTTAILRYLESRSLWEGPYSKAASIFDTICMDLQMVYRCSKYCRRNPTSQYKKICKVPMSTYTGTFASYPIPLINSEFSFLLESSHFMSPAYSLAKASYLRV